MSLNNDPIATLISGSSSKMSILGDLIYDPTDLKKSDKMELMTKTVNIGLATGKWLEIVSIQQGIVEIKETNETSFRAKMLELTKKGKINGIAFKDYIVTITWEMIKMAKLELEKEINMVITAYWLQRPASIESNELLGRVKLLKEPLKSQKMIIEMMESSNNVPNGEETGTNTKEGMDVNQKENNEEGSGKASSLNKKVESASTVKDGTTSSKQESDHTAEELENGTNGKNNARTSRLAAYLESQNFMDNQFDATRYQTFVIEAPVDSARIEAQTKGAQQRLANMSTHGITNGIANQRDALPTTVRRSLINGCEPSEPAEVNSWHTPVIKEDGYLGASSLYGLTESHISNYIGKENPFDPLDKFDGDSLELVEEFIFKVENIAKLYQINEYSIVPLLTAKLTGSAFQTALRLSKTNGGIIRWKTFKEEFMASCNTCDMQFELRNQLCEISFDNCGRNYAKFITKFKSIVNRLIGVKDDEILFYFEKALPKDLRIKVREDPTAVTWKQAMIIASRYASYTGLEELETVNTARQVWQQGNKQEGDEMVSTNNARDIEKRQAYLKSNLAQRNQDESINGRSKEWKSKQKRCYNCNSPNHLVRDCDKIELNDETDAEYDGTDDDGDQYEYENEREEYLNIIEASGPRKLLSVIAKIRGQWVNCVLDPGSTASVVSIKVEEKYELNTHESQTHLRSHDGKKESALGITNLLQVIVGNNETRIKFIVSKMTDYQVILGLDWFYSSGFELNVRKRIIRRNREIVPLDEYNPPRNEENGINDQASQLKIGTTSMNEDDATANYHEMEPQKKQLKHMSLVMGTSDKTNEPTEESRVWRGPATRFIVLLGTVEETEVRIVVNTGTTQSMISSMLVDKLGQRCKLEAHNDVMRCLNGMVVKSKGLTSQLTLGFSRIVKPREYIMQFMVINMKCEVILGMDFFEMSKALINTEKRCLVFTDDIEKAREPIIFDNYGNEVEVENSDDDNSAMAIVERMVTNA